MARLGGDEFAMVPAGATEAIARIGALRLLAKLSEPIVVEGHPLQIGASLGIAVYPLHGSDVLTLMRHADVAMYVAKRAGGGLAVYDAAQDLPSPVRLTMETDLRHAIAAGNLHLEFQPKVNVATGQVCGVEALVRWRHPVLGQAPPDQFIPLAEQTGLVTPLTEWVLKATLRQLQTWEQRGLVLHAAINLSTVTLHDASLPDTMARLLERFQIDARRVTLEVTESALMADPAKAGAVITRPAALGVSLSIDDFGMGYSSLNYLMDLPVTEIKIDKSFVLGMETNRRNAAIVRAISDLGRNLGLRVVAEGVETRDALRNVRILECTVVQGYYISPPLSATALEEWIAGTGREHVIAEGPFPFALLTEAS